MSKNLNLRTLTFAGDAPKTTKSRLISLWATVIS